MANAFIAGGMMATAIGIGVIYGYIRAIKKIMQHTNERLKAIEEHSGKLERIMNKVKA
jgi:hypothetical protein